MKKFGGTGVQEALNEAVFSLLGLLVVVLATGKIRGGAQRWLSLGAFNFQPSEFAGVVGAPLIVGGACRH
jgi:cell division protein FtsW (lipid II flippase)